MGTGYTRNDTANNIADGNVINASDLDGEFDAVQAAFNGTTGHSHDGTSGEGPQIAAGGIASNAVTTAKILDGNVTTAKIANANVTLAKMAANSIDSDQYVDGSIDTAHIANDAVTGDKLANNIQIAGTLGVTGETTLTTHLNMGDGDIIKLGASSDLQIFHDGSNSRIQETGTGNLFIDADASVNFRGNSGSENMAKFNANGAVQLYYDDAEKLATTSTGIDVTGVITTDGMTTSADINFGDNDKILMGGGSGGDLRIYHDGTNSVVSSENTTDLYLQGNNINLRSSIPGAENGITIAGDGAVTLFHDNAAKLATTATGATVTGELLATTVDATTLQIGGTSITATAAELNYNDITTLGAVTASKTVTADSSGFINFSDNQRLRFGAGADLQIYHDASNSYINDGGTGNLFIGGTNLYLRSATGESYLAAVQDGAVTVYHDNSAKLSTTSTGVAVTGNISVSGTVDGRDVASDGSKLDGIEANAKNDQTITAGNGLTGGGTGDVTVNVGAGTGISVSADAVALAAAGAGAGTYGSTSDGTKIDTITLDAYGRVTAVATGGTGSTSTSGTVTSVATGGGLTGGTITGSGTISHADTSSQASVDNSGSNFIQDITLDTYGHVTGITSAAAGSATSGSYTPSVAMGNSVNSLVILGYYVKVDEMVFVQSELSYTKNSGLSYIRIGLPFAAKSASFINKQPLWGYIDNGGLNDTSYAFYIAEGGTDFRRDNNPNNGQFQNTRYNFNFLYRANS